jgi:hypothetical protein
MKYGHGANPVMHAASGSGEPRRFLAQMFGVWQRAGGGGLDELFGERAYADWQTDPIARASTRIGAGFPVVCAAGTIFALAILVRGLRARILSAASAAPAPILVLFAAIIISVPIEYALVQAAPVAHYHFIVQPGLAVLAAAGAHEIVRRRGARAGWVLYGALLAFALVFALQSASLQMRVFRYPSLILGGNGPIYAGAREALDRDLAAALEEVRTGAERRAAEDARSAALFAQSDDVLFSYSGVTGEPPLRPFGAMRLEPGPQGTRATVEVPPALVDTPEFAVREHGLVVVRIDITTPIEADLVLFYQTEKVRDFKRTQKVVRQLPRGRSDAYVVLPAAGLRGPLRLWLGQTRSLIHSIEVRAVDTGS